ncbi:hypothetical protein [Brevibacillus sp. DP1.3A]|uniref:hypothetical protein n=1 Tax=Brevibacillus sp. DP1.3A TaxID=2738867 RepID=UPI00156B484A|nr:hypothetical protein [Brevibacillus sp. DP1.3A]UED78121.1 hypothetical protein HP399_031000 [Brevibacillus sp. DP1.3A]
MRKFFEIRAYIETDSEVTKSEISRSLIAFLNSKEFDLNDLTVKEVSLESSSNDGDLWDDFDESDTCEICGK